MTFVANRRMMKGLQRAFFAVALGLGIMGNLAAAAPVSPATIRSEAIAAPIEKVQVRHRGPVVVHHHHRRPVVVHHHHRRPVVVHHHHRRHQHCWWSHGRRICRWR